MILDRFAHFFLLSVFLVLCTASASLAQSEAEAATAFSGPQAQVPRRQPRTPAHALGAIRDAPARWLDSLMVQARPGVPLGETTLRLYRYSKQEDRAHTVFLILGLIFLALGGAAFLMAMQEFKIARNDLYGGSNAGLAGFGLLLLAIMLGLPGFIFTLIGLILALKRPARARKRAPGAPAH